MDIFVVASLAGMLCVITGVVVLVKLHAELIVLVVPFILTSFSVIRIPQLVDDQVVNDNAPVLDAFVPRLIKQVSPSILFALNCPEAFGINIPPLYVGSSVFRNNTARLAPEFENRF